MPALLDVIDLSLYMRSDRGNIPILKKINFSLQSGETVALVGESGSGKSLTALAIMQLLPPAAFIDPISTIRLSNADLLTFSEIMMRCIRGRKIALIFQEAMSALNPVMTIGEQIDEVLTYHFKLSRRNKRQRAIALLTEVGIPDPDYYLQVYPHQLSGGLRQRAMIAIALAGEPDLLIADEPTTALDVTLQAQIIKLLKKLQHNRGMGLIFITHDLGVVYQIADHVVVMYQGEVVESNTADRFFRAPQHPYSQRLFAALPGWLSRPERVNQSAESLLKVEALKVYYPIKKGLFKRTVGYVKAVDDVSFEIKQGETLALVGESGSGKTTLAMAILRLTPQTSGHILLSGKELARPSAHQLQAMRRVVQVVFQDPYGSMNPRLRVSDIIGEALNILGIRGSLRQRRIEELLCCVGLDPESQYRYPHEFSGGQRQRICIARALAVEPTLLICDEPTSALDVSAQMQVLALLLRLQQEKGLSYLLITHNIAVVSYMADTVAVLYKGKLVEAGPATEVLTQPREAYTQKLMAAVPTVPKAMGADVIIS